MAAYTPLFGEMRRIMFGLCSHWVSRYVWHQRMEQFGLGEWLSLSGRFDGFTRMLFGHGYGNSVELAST